MLKNKEYNPLTVPKLTWNKKTLTETYGELSAQPLEPGFGMTIGNALRRVLLGAIEGSAVTSVVISDVNNEFSAIQGVVEDAMQVLLNVKDIVIKNTTGMPGTMRLKVKKEGPVRVSDIVADKHLELINSDHIIAHISAGGSLEMEFTVDTGRGYQKAKWPLDKVYQEDGKVYLDASFSTIRRVTFDIKKTRVGGAIDYDKLILKVTTDGSEDPVSVVNYATSVLRTQLEHFLLGTEIPFNEISAAHEQIEKQVAENNAKAIDLKGISAELLLKPVEELELSVRAHNCLLNAGVKTVIDLVNIVEDDLLKVKNFGRKSLNEVKDHMKLLGLSFGMNIKQEDVETVFAATQQENE